MYHKEKKNKSEMENIQMDINRTFIEIDSFTKKWKSMGLTEDDLVVFQ